MGKVVFTEWNPMAVIMMAKQVSKTNLEQASQMLIDKIKEDMRLPKSGRKYGFHTASAEGESPAVLSSKLINALEYKIIDEGNSIISQVGFWDGEGKGYGVLLELGTDNGQMKPRPFLRSTMFQNEDEIRRILSG